jgi:hypothetical protein
MGRSRFKMCICAQDTFPILRMAKIVVGSSSITQPLLLYPGLGPAMLEQHRRSDFASYAIDNSYQS